MKLYKLEECIKNVKFYVVKGGENLFFVDGNNPKILEECFNELGDKEIKSIKCENDSLIIELQTLNYYKRRYLDFKEKGLCPKCGRPNNSKKVFCNDCLNIKKEDKLRMYLSREYLGLCKKCGTNLTYRDIRKDGETFKHCHVCRQKSRLKQRKYDAKKRGDKNE